MDAVRNTTTSSTSGPDVRRDGAAPGTDHDHGSRDHDAPRHRGGPGRHGGGGFCGPRGRHDHDDGGPDVQGEPRGVGRGPRHGGHDGPRGPWARHDGEGDGPDVGRGHGPGRGRGPGGPGGRGRGRGPGGRGPGGPGGPGGGRGGDPELPGFLPPGARVGRGDIRAGILVLLLEGPMHGYQLIGELHDRSGGVWRPSPGSVYPTLKRLSADELITSAEGGGRGHRRAFTLTDQGTEEATRLAAESTPWEALVGDDDRGALELRDLVVSVVDAARQVVRVAEPAQAEEAKQVLVEARRRLYGILAAEPAGGPTAGARAESTAGASADSASADGAADEADAAESGDAS